MRKKQNINYTCSLLLVQNLGLLSRYGKISPSNLLNTNLADFQETFY